MVSRAPSHQPGPYARHPIPPAAVRRRLRPRSKAFRLPEWLARLVLLASLAALLVIPLLAILGAYAFFQISGRIVPGVRVGGSDLGGLTPIQAAVALQEDWNLERRMRVADGIGYDAQVQPQQLGLSVDVQATVRNAQAVGRGQGFVANAAQMQRAVSEGWEVAPVVVLDEEAALAGLAALSQQVSLAPVDAALRMDGGQLVEIPARLGYTVDSDLALAVLRSDPRGVLLGGGFQIPLKPVGARIVDVSAARQQAERLLSAPLTLNVYDPVTNERLTWTVSPETMGAWLRVDAGENGPQIAIDPTRVAEYLAAQSGALGPERWLDAGRYSGAVAQALAESKSPTLLVNHHPTTYTVQRGDTLISIAWKVGMPYWRLMQANPQVNANALTAGQELVVPSKDDLLPLPVVPDKRIVISISRQRMWIYQDGQEIAEHVISTGMNRSPTQPGIFQVQTHELDAYASIWDLRMPHFLGIYEAWPGFMNGIHGLPMLSNGRRLWANVLGKPASYGCIILNLQAAEDLYNWAENGVVVEIQA